jgi:tetratricopeptide (TPR) repeat protein
MRARAEYQVNEYRAAQASAERCLALEPTFRAAWGLLETVHVRQGRLALARAARQRLDELRAVPLAAPKDPIPSPLRAAPGTAWRPVAPPPSRAPLVLVKPPATGSFETPTLAEVYRRQGLLDRALEVYRRILERHPDDVGAQAMVRKLEDELSARRHHAEAV